MIGLGYVCLFLAVLVVLCLPELIALSPTFNISRSASMTLSVILSIPFIILGVCYIRLAYEEKDEK